MNIKDIENIIEAILFIAGDPVSFHELGLILKIDTEQVKNIVTDFSEQYNNKNTALDIIILADSVQIVTKPQYIENIKEYKQSALRHKKFLSRAALEILAIVAYNQPITKGYIEQTRGVDSAYTVNMLVEKNFLEERGRLEAPGRPILYGTTLKFLRCFGLTTLSDLPDKEKFKNLMENLNGAEENVNNT